MDFKVVVLSQHKDGKSFNVTVDGVDRVARPRSGSTTSHIINLKADAPVQNITIKSELLVVGSTIIHKAEPKAKSDGTTAPRVKAESNVFRALLDVDLDGSLTLGYVINKKLVKIDTITNKALLDAFALIKGARELVSKHLTVDVVKTLDDYNKKMVAIESARAQGFPDAIIEQMKATVTAPAGLDAILSELTDKPEDAPTEAKPE